MTLRTTPLSRKIADILNDSTVPYTEYLYLPPTEYSAALYNLWILGTPSSRLRVSRINVDRLACEFYPQPVI